MQKTCTPAIDAAAVTDGTFGPGNGPIVLSNVQCTGTESTLLSCQADPLGVNDCDHSQDAGVVCPPSKQTWHVGRRSGASYNGMGRKGVSLCNTACYCSFKHNNNCSLSPYLGIQKAKVGLLECS